ncbi:MAG: NusG domain II-containing protein [Oscillospiraceae bacterium]|nr:NusG domain II-containing protein [Oscillospiraceae bacterium]
MRDIKILRKPDIILTAAFLFFAFMFYFIFDLSFKSDISDNIIIKVNGVIYQEAPLSQDEDIEVYNGAGILLNTVRIKDGRVSVIYAVCPDKLCMRENYFNNLTVCLPNRLTIEIISGKNRRNNYGDFDIII